jgi:hypothetical protein
MFVYTFCQKILVFNQNKSYFYQKYLNVIVMTTFYVVSVIWLIGYILSMRLGIKFMQDELGDNIVIMYLLIGILSTFSWLMLFAFWIGANIQNGKLLQEKNDRLEFVKRNCR